MTTAAKRTPSPFGQDTLARLEGDILPAYICARRWYAAKDAGVPRVRVVGAQALPAVGGGTVQLCRLRVEPPDRPAQTYALPLALSQGMGPMDAFTIAQAGTGRWTGTLRDGFGDAAFVRALLDGMRQGHRVEGLRFHRTAALADLEDALDAGTPLHWPGAEQSNTSVRIGDVAIFKAFRKLDSGVHPELEMARHLTEARRFANTPALLGWIEWAGEGGETGGESAVLAVLQRLVPDAVDGWAHVTGRLAERLAAFRDGDAGEDAELLELMRTLGRRTAGLHRALAADGDDPAFRPEPVDAATLRGWAESVRATARGALEGLRGALPWLDPATAVEAAALAASEQAVMAQIDALIPATLDAVRTRLHSDFHLGQVLIAGGDVHIIDFEGEPMRPLAERRAKHSPLRDVAGMLRSIAYATATARRGLPADPPEADRAAREAWLAWWEDRASGAFLDGYRTAIAGCTAVPADGAVAARLLKLFVLEKALYEVGYELANRPDWLPIPLAGALGALAADAGPEVADAHAGPVGLAAPGAVPLGEARAHAMPFGAQVQPDGTVRFRLWAPTVEHVSLCIEHVGHPLPMLQRGGGWYEWTTAQAHAGTRYRFLLPDGTVVPDPASRYQPDDVTGPSEVIDPTVYRWSDTGWRGRPWHETVLYELHVGTFTPEGTFRATIDRLDDLVELGVTAIELMPVADFPGTRNWGYDGVLPYAPEGAYGRPEDLKALVDAAHGRGLMVFLDVVYNHFGPEGNYLNPYAASFFTDRHHTPWGSAINVDGPDSATVRDFFIHNALYWIEEFHLDGLRFDAVHAIIDDSDPPFLKELAERVRALAGGRRHVHLVLENDANQARFLERHRDDGDPRWHTAQWSDDLHHGLHSAATGEGGGYYAPYAGDAGKLGRALAEGFAFQGEPSPFHGGEPRGEPSAHLPPTAFVSFVQNHDQIGNRALGERITALAPAQAVRAVTCLTLLGPQIPMLFMGEEWASARPFPFFCDFGPELGAAVREGRRNEFAAFPEFQDAASRARIPDPNDPATMALARLDWEARTEPPHAERLAWYRRALEVRRREIVPRLAGIPGGAARYHVIGGRAVGVAWRLGDGSRLHLRANLSGAPVPGVDEPPGRVLWTEGPGLRDGALAPWSVVWRIEEPSALDRLAERMGIEESYTDAAGRTVRTAPATTCALLRAMGVDLADDRADDAAAAERLAALERAELTRALPPVVVRRIDQPPFAVPVTLPDGTGELRWTLMPEDATADGGNPDGGTQDGGTRRGTVDFANLPLIRHANLDGTAMAVRRLDLGAPPPAGYLRLRVETAETAAETVLIAAPDRCHLPAPLAMGERVWGLAAQLYALRSGDDWGMGDFGDLANLAEVAAGRGAAVVGVNPLHALFLDQPEQASPYSPASRLFLNPLYIDVGAVPELPDCPDALARLADETFRRELEAAKAKTLVDYTAVARLKLGVLEMLFRTFRDSAPEERRARFAAFRAEQGAGLERFCVFQALREHFAGQAPPVPDWRRWPEPFRDPESAEVAAFARDHRDRVDFLAWLQWVADDQLAIAAERARARGMAIGLYRDLAVGADSAGAETWAAPRVVVSAAHVGAPPDLFNPAGQDWGLPPFHPRALREEGYASFIALLRANMRHAGGLRIDHAMALRHVFWIPEGGTPADGAYVAYPMEDLLGILALESRRHGCLVVGEDLGTVPEGFRERMAEAGVLSYRVVFFEWDGDGGFVGPDEYPALALATVGSHDLATLRGWWEGRDIALKVEHGLYPDPGEAERQRARRTEERGRLIDAIRAAGLPLPASFGPDSPYEDALGQAVHGFLARANAAIAMMQLEDLTAESAQVNLPGTVDEHPNWRRKLPLSLEELANDPRAVALTAILAAARPAATREDGHG